uniref:Uncharacterized protein n=1 Tax=Anopheles merus TaxID=30066 RepID=A0A182V9B4_ANOME
MRFGPPTTICWPAIRCWGEVMRGAGDVSRPGREGEGDGPPPGPGLNGFSSICEWGVPMRGDGCIVLYGDMALFELVWLPPGLCSTDEFTLAGPGLCDSSGLGECSGLWFGCRMRLLSGDCTVGWYSEPGCELGDGDISGDGGAISDWAGELPGAPTGVDAPDDAGLPDWCFVLYSCSITECWRCWRRAFSSCFWMTLHDFRLVVLQLVGQDGVLLVQPVLVVDLQQPILLGGDRFRWLWRLRLQLLLSTGNGRHLHLLLSKLLLHLLVLLLLDHLTLCGGKIALHRILSRCGTTRTSKMLLHNTSWTGHISGGDRAARSNLLLLLLLLVCIIHLLKRTGIDVFTALLLSRFCISVLRFIVQLEAVEQVGLFAVGGIQLRISILEDVKVIAHLGRQ